MKQNNILYFEFTKNSIILFISKVKCTRFHYFFGPYSFQYLLVQLFWVCKDQSVHQGFQDQDMFFNRPDQIGSKCNNIFGIFAGYAGLLKLSKTRLGWRM